MVYTTEAVSSPIQEAEEEAETVAAAPAVSGAPGGVPNLPAAGLQAKPGRKRMVTWWIGREDEVDFPNDFM